MTDCTDDCQLAALCSQRHWSIFWLIIVATWSIVAGRILTAGISRGPGETTPFFSANDRSRWATIRALGDDGKFEIDHVISDQRSRIRWDTIDKVQHPGADGQLHFYSSKPPFLSTLLAGVYWIVKLGSGWNLANNPTEVVRTVLLIFNGGCWLVFLWLLARSLELLPLRDWTRYYVVAAAGVGTFLSTFAVTLNNHLPAATSAMAALYCLLQWRKEGTGNASWYWLAGFASALAAAFELPAALLLVATALTAASKSLVRFVFCFLPAALAVIGGFLFTNYLAHGDLRPPYAHRSDGPLVATLEGNFAGDLDRGLVPPLLSEVLKEHSLVLPQIAPASWHFDGDANLKRWVVQDLETFKFTIVRRESGSRYELRRWNHWYAYKGSYWISDKKSDVDQGEPDTAVYAFHILFGHHGVFSLTPIWLLSLAGLAGWLFTNQYRLRWFAFMAVGISMAVFAFYLFWVSAHDRNYGGQTSAFRWAFWLAPFWLIGMVPVVDWLSKSRQGRTACLVALLLSALSAYYSAANPWVHPWLFQIWEWTDLPK